MIISPFFFVRASQPTEINQSQARNFFKGKSHLRKDMIGLPKEMCLSRSKIAYAAGTLPLSC